MIYNKEERDMNKMLKSFKKFKRDISGAIGIGAMIVFIAMVLVAGIAASVLIQTSTRLESQAMTTGEHTTAEVSTGIAITDVQGHVTASRIDLMAVLVRPRAGSFDIDLSTTVLELSDSNNKYILTYDSTNFQLTAAVAGVFSTSAFDTLTADDFGVIVLEDADNSLSSTNPVINRGDKVLLTVNASTTFGSGGIAGRADIWGRVIPENGVAGVIAFRTPASLTDVVYDLL
jgi:flagellin FlaB